MAKEILFIEILNWKKFNGRGDVKNSTWLRLQNSLAFDPEWDHFNGEEIWVWVFLLCLASMKNREIVEIATETIKSRARVSIESVHSSIQKLTIKKCIRMRTGRVTRSLRERAPTDGRTDETDGRDGHVKSSTPLLEIWNRHKGSLPEARGCKGKRLTSANARWSENPSTEYWAEIIDRMAKSDFCLGKKNHPGRHENWKADFDFLIQPDTQHKVLEGKYDNSVSGGKYVDPEILKIRKQLQEEETNGAA